MVYVQFYRENPDGTLVEPCGDRAVVILDARCSRTWMGETARTECLKRGYDAWRIFKGSRFDNSTPISQLWPVVREEPVRNPVWLSAHGM